MSIDSLEAAIKDAKKRGIEDISLILNTSTERFCQVGILQVSVSEITGIVIYADNSFNDCLGYIKPQKK